MTIDLSSGTQHARLVAYYEQAGPDFAQWSTGFNMHFGMTPSLGLLMPVWSCAVAAQTRGPLELASAPVPPAQRIAYGKDPLQFGELRVPSAKGPHPVAIVVHGGCWAARLGTMDQRAVAVTTCARSRPP